MTTTQHALVTTETSNHVEPAENTCAASRVLLTRRLLLGASSAMAFGSAFAAPPVVAAVGSEPIEVASLFDLTGNLNIYGIMQMNVSRYAIDAINASGGVLGRELKLHTFDTQSKIELYSRYAQEIGANDKIVAVVGCFTGASREATRPILSRFKKPLFFPTIDEGGECDRYTLMQGTDCVQQQTPLVTWATEKVGKNFYVIAADYVYGHVATAWTRLLVGKAGGTVNGVEFIPLEVSDFSSTIRKIQTAGPAVIMSHLVGSSHIAFYRQFAAAGLGRSIQIVSPTFGLGNEQQVLSPEEGQGIVVAYSYFEGLDNPQNKDFLSGFRKAFPAAGVVADTPAQIWNAWHQWKLAVEKANSTEVDKIVVALKSGIPFDGPAGRVVLDAPSHRNIQDVRLARVNNAQSYDIMATYDQMKPSREVPGGGDCDLTGKDANAHRMIKPK